MYTREKAQPLSRSLSEHDVTSQIPSKEMGDECLLQAARRSQKEHTL